MSLKVEISDLKVAGLIEAIAKRFVVLSKEKVIDLAIKSYILSICPPYKNDSGRKGMLGLGEYIVGVMDQEIAKCHATYTGKS